VFDDLLGALERAPFITGLRDSYLTYPLVNTLHIVGIALLFGAIVPLDLRLIGWRREAGPVDRLESLLQPVAIAGLVIAIPAGLLLFATDARAYAASPLFRAKMLLIAAAIANALWLRASNSRAAKPGRRVAIAAAASVLLWLTAIILGRLLGYL
jgi:hypothetical protein